MDENQLMSLFVMKILKHFLLKISWSDQMSYAYFHHDFVISPSVYIFIEVQQSGTQTPIETWIGG